MDNTFAFIRLYDLCHRSQPLGVLEQVFPHSMALTWSRFHTPLVEEAWPWMMPKTNAWPRPVSHPGMVVYPRLILFPFCAWFKTKYPVNVFPVKASGSKLGCVEHTPKMVNWHFVVPRHLLLSGVILSTVPIDNSLCLIRLLSNDFLYGSRPGKFSQGVWPQTRR